MRGKITFFDPKSGQGRIQAGDGRILIFAAQDVLTPEGQNPAVRQDTAVSFETEGDRAVKVTPETSVSGDGEEAFYQECQDFYLSPDEKPRDGCEIAAQSPWPVSCEARLEDNARVKLEELCRSVGANTVLKFTRQKKIRYSAGCAFYYYVLEGYPAVSGVKGGSGAELSLNELAESLDLNAVKKIKEREKSARRGKKALAVLGALLLLSFALGFVWARMQGA